MATDDQFLYNELSDYRADQTCGRNRRREAAEIWIQSVLRPRCVLCLLKKRKHLRVLRASLISNAPKPQAETVIVGVFSTSACFCSRH